MNNIFKIFLGAIFALNLSAAVAETDDVVQDVDMVEVADVDIADDAVDVADEEGAISKAVTARMDCNAIRTKIDELNSAGDDTGQADILRQRYRKDCVVKSAISRAANSRATMRRGIKPAAPTSSDTTGASNATTTAAPKVESNGTVTAEQKKMCDKLFEKMADFDDEKRALLRDTYDSYCAPNKAAPDNVVKMTMIILDGGTAGNDTDVADAGASEEEKNAKIIANLEAGLCADGEKPNKFGCCAGEKFKEVGNLEFACCPESGGNCFPPIL